MDGCCLNRLTDDQSQIRIHREAEAVEVILQLVQNRTATWVSSRVLEIEIARNPDVERRHDVLALLAFTDEIVIPATEDADRAESLQRLGFGEFDALHLACAERGLVDVFLTTDDGLVRRAARHAQTLRVSVRNPLSWYKEFQT